MEKRERSTSDTAQTRRTGQTFDAFQAGDRRSWHPEADAPAQTLRSEYFIDRFARRARKSIRRINKKTWDLLRSYPWPGNIRELQNVIERSVIVCETENFSVDESWLSRQPTATGPAKSPLDLSEKLAAQERDH